jgi:hypothetical protein
MATAVKRKLSGSTDGKPIKVSAISTPGTAIHAAVAGTTPGTFDEIWLWAQNNHTGVVILTIEFGSADAWDNIIRTIALKAGLDPIVPGLLLQNGMTVKAFADVADMISISGFVNAITD